MIHVRHALAWDATDQRVVDIGLADLDDPLIPDDPQDLVIPWPKNKNPENAQEYSVPKDRKRMETEASMCSEVYPIDEYVDLVIGEVADRFGAAAGWAAGKAVKRMLRTSGVVCVVRG